MCLYKKSQHGCIRWALHEHITPPCGDLACGGLKDCFKWSCKQRPICIKSFFCTRHFILRPNHFFFILMKLQTGTSLWWADYEMVLQTCSKILLPTIPSFITLFPDNSFFENQIFEYMELQTWIPFVMGGHWNDVANIV